MVTGTAETFARRLRQERELAGLTQMDLADLLAGLLEVRVHATAITKVEKREREVRITEAVAIAEALRLPLSALLHDEDSVSEQIAGLRRELNLAQGRVAQLGTEMERAQASVSGTLRRIQELEAARRR